MQLDLLAKISQTRSFRVIKKELSAFTQFTRSKKSSDVRDEKKNLINFYSRVQEEKTESRRYYI